MQSNHPSFHGCPYSPQCYCNANPTHPSPPSLQTIRSAPDAAAASAALQSAPFELSKEQAEGVLGLTLRRLTSLEAAKLQEEQATLRAK